MRAFSSLKNKKASKKHGCLVHGALLVVLRISRPTGLAPLHFDFREDGCFITLSSEMSLASYLFITLLTLTSTVALVLDLSGDREKSVRASSTMNSLVWFSDIAMAITISSLGVYRGPSRMKRMMQYITTLTKVNNNLNIKMKKTPEKKITTMILVHLGLTILLLLTDYWTNINRSLEYNRNFTLACMYFTFYIQYFMVYLFQIQFILIALTVKTSLKSLNYSFHDLSKNIQKQVFVKPCFIENKETRVLSKKTDNVNFFVDNLNYGSGIPFNLDTHHQPITPNETIRHLGLLYGALCDVIQQVNCHYGPILLVMLFSFFVHLVISPYYLIVHLRSDHKVYKSLLLLIWCIVHVVNMFLVVEPCHRTSQEIERTKEIVSRCMSDLQSSASSVALQLDVVAKQFLLRTVRYAPMGMCILDRPLITSILAAVTTYLVILIQFQTLSEVNIKGTV